MVWRFILLHLTALLALTTEFNTAAVVVFLGSYSLRLFGVSCGYHRYFSHHSFKTSRLMQFFLAFLGCAAGQRGPLWWASQHRKHHRYSDTEMDHHSPHHMSRFEAHMGWTMRRQFLATDHSMVKDWAKFPELAYINRFHWLAMLVWVGGMVGLGEFVGSLNPQSGTSGWQFVVYGFFLSTLATAHVTLSVNTFGHTVGSQRFNAGDQSRNVWWLAIPSFGDGWHNNHHRFPESARHGLTWFEVDINYLALRVLSSIGLVWDIRTPDRNTIRSAEKTRPKADPTKSGDTHVAEHS